VFRAWRRRRVLARAAIPDDLWNEALAAHPVLVALEPAALARVRELALLFLHEKHIEPAIGFSVTESMRVRIAALACMPILHLGLDCYEGFAAVIVYPDEFVVRDREYVDEAGVVTTGDDVLTGEAWEQGPVILSWPDVEASGRGEGYNVVAHEFAHKLDMLDGEADGIPPLHADMRIPEWRAAFDAAYDDLLERLDRGEEPWLDPYAAEDPAELFAVCAELFFDVPGELRSHYPDVYEQLRAYFRQDPAATAGAARPGL
jgi:Mlc titration factor MtfA (ptsG expression regulator)